MWSNCLIWALRQEARKGGFVKSRPSRYGWWRHWMWSPDGKEWWSYSPDDPRHKPIPPPLFRGSVKREE